MKSIKEIAGQQLNNLQKLPTEVSLKSQTNEISIYRGSLTTPAVIANIARIKKSFPTLPIGFYEILSERLKENHFNDDRLKDAVAHVIDTCVYPTPTIANFISYDKRVKVYTYSEYCKLCDEGTGKNYKPVALEGRTHPVWAHENDINQYNLKLWTNL